MNYYTDNDPKICAWLEELVKAKLIPPGKVDCRCIKELAPDDIQGFTQCHFFCGIAGWPYALELAGWSRNRPVWSASLPCQPFSQAGKGLAERDERHLWPAFRRLVAFCAPPVLFGEQVASRAGREWLSRVFDDLEAMGYVCAGADLPACCVGAPHIRQRLFWMADAERNGPQGREPARREETGVRRRSSEPGGEAIWLADTKRNARNQGGIAKQPKSGPDETETGTHAKPGRCCYPGRLGDASKPGLQVGEQSSGLQHALRHEGTPALAASPWRESNVILCGDGKTRRIPVEPAFFPLAYGIPGRVAQLRGLGNAIVPQVAAEFVRAIANMGESR